MSGSELIFCLTTEDKRVPSHNMCGTDAVTHIYTASLIDQIRSCRIHLLFNEFMLSYLCNNYDRGTILLTISNYPEQT